MPMKYIGINLVLNSIQKANGFLAAIIFPELITKTIVFLDHKLNQFFIESKSKTLLNEYRSLQKQYTQAPKTQQADLKNRLEESQKKLIEFFRTQSDDYLKVSDEVTVLKKDLNDNFRIYLIRSIIFFSVISLLFSVVFFGLGPSVFVYPVVCILFSIPVIQIVATFFRSFSDKLGETAKTFGKTVNRVYDMFTLKKDKISNFLNKNPMPISTLLNESEIDTQIIYSTKALTLYDRCGLLKINEMMRKKKNYKEFSIYNLEKTVYHPRMQPSIPSKKMLIDQCTKRVTNLKSSMNEEENAVQEILKKSFDKIKKIYYSFEDNGDLNDLKLTQLNMKNNLASEEIQRCYQELSQLGLNKMPDEINIIINSLKEMLHINDQSTLIGILSDIKSTAYQEISNLNNKEVEYDLISKCEYFLRKLNKEKMNSKKLKYIYKFYADLNQKNLANKARKACPSTFNSIDRLLGIDPVCRKNYEDYQTAYAEWMKKLDEVINEEKSEDSKKFFQLLKKEAELLAPKDYVFFNHNMQAIGYSGSQGLFKFLMNETGNKWIELLSETSDKSDKNRSKAPSKKTFEEVKKTLGAIQKRSKCLNEESQDVFFENLLKLRGCYDILSMTNVYYEVDSLIIRTRNLSIRLKKSIQTNFTVEGDVVDSSTFIKQYETLSKQKLHLTTATTEALLSDIKTLFADIDRFIKKQKEAEKEAEKKDKMVINSLTDAKNVLQSNIEKMPFIKNYEGVLNDMNNQIATIEENISNIDANDFSKSFDEIYLKLDKLN